MFNVQKFLITKIFVSIWFFIVEGRRSVVIVVFVIAVVVGFSLVGRVVYPHFPSQKRLVGQGNGFIDGVGSFKIYEPAIFELPILVHPPDILDFPAILEKLGYIFLIDVPTKVSDINCGAALGFWRQRAIVLNRNGLTEATSAIPSAISLQFNSDWTLVTRLAYHLSIKFQRLRSGFGIVKGDKTGSRKPVIILAMVPLDGLYLSAFAE